MLLTLIGAYPPEYQSNVANECPDGSIITSERLRLEKWGSCWNRYYELNVEYYMSTASRSILCDLTQNYLWIKSFKRDGQDDDADGGGGGGKAGGSEAIKVQTLREISADARSIVGSGGSGSSFHAIGGAAGGTCPIANAAKVNPLVRKLRSTATKALTKQSARCVQKKVFASLNQPVNEDAPTRTATVQADSRRDDERGGPAARGNDGCWGLLG